MKIKDSYKVYIALLLLILLVVGFKVSEGFTEYLSPQATQPTPWFNSVTFSKDGKTQSMPPNSDGTCRYGWKKENNLCTRPSGHPGKKP